MSVDCGYGVMFDGWNDCGVFLVAVDLCMLIVCMVADFEISLS